MRRTPVSRSIAAALVLTLAAATPASAAIERYFQLLYALFLVNAHPLASLMEAAPTSRAAVYRLSNVGDPGNEPGEPSLGGKMKKTVWAGLTVPQSQRVVIHTFGSDFDTVLAAYTGNAVNALTAVTSNDDRQVPGAVNDTHSLIQFIAAANIRYHIQIGSKTGDEGDTYAAVFIFPPAGGLSAYMATVGGTVWNGRDYVCGYGSAPLSACGNPLFILHNSTTRTLRVTASSTLGPGVAAPAAFDIPPNGIRTARFSFTGAFDTTTTRTVAGHFTFIGQENGTNVARADHRALIVVGNASLGDVLRAAVEPAVRAGGINASKSFDVTLTNTGSQTAIGCHARHDFSFSSRLKVNWRRFDPNTGNYTGPLNRPVNIAPGRSASIRVFVASQQTQLADPEFPTEVTLDCANTGPAPIDLKNAFDLTALGVYQPAQVEVEKLVPAGDTLNVPASGAASLRASVVNRSAPAVLRVIPVYLHPFGDSPNTLFSVEVCKTANENGPCQSPPTGSIQYNAARNVKAFFRIFVRAPAVNPGFDAGKRRVFLKVWQEAPVDEATFDAVVAAESVAVRKN
jgi:hypothetical protein